MKTTSSESGSLEKVFIVNGQEVKLTMAMVPALVCYGAQNRQTPKPCDIFIDFTCTLSRAVNGYVTVAIQKKNIMESTDPSYSGSQDEAGVVFNIAPNTTKFSYRSSFQNNNNITVDEHKFTIENVSFYQFQN